MVGKWGEVGKLRLDSWKSIAGYLERSSRTVQRWHALQALPVHHFGGARGSVFAYPEEIDRWLVSFAGEARQSGAVEIESMEDARERSQEWTAQALEMWQARSEENLNTIAGLFRKAIELDPGNTRALTGLADAMIASSLLGLMDSSLAYSCAAETLGRAAQLERDSVDAMLSSAWLDLLHNRRWRQARASFGEVLLRYPHRSFAHSGRAMLSLAEGDTAGAIKRGWLAWRQNMLVPSLGSQVCWSHLLAGDFEQALEVVAEVRASGGGGAWLSEIEGLARIQHGGADALERVEALASMHPRSQTLRGILGYGYGTHCRPGKAWQILRELEQMQAQKRAGAYALALVAVGLGLTEDAMRWLDTSFAEGSVWSLGFRCDPILRRLQGEARFESLLRKIGDTRASVAPIAVSAVRLARAM